MDHAQFDALARIVSRRQSRRGALAALLSAAAFRFHPAPAAARRTRIGRRRVRAQAATVCYPGTRCTPGRGKNTSGCDFSRSVLFSGLDARGSNLSNTNLSGADARGADFRGANLSGACLVGADLLDARLGASVNLGKAVFCNTRMPDGSPNHRDCARGTPCCLAPDGVGSIPVPDRCSAYLFYSQPLDSWGIAGFRQCFPDPGLGCRQTFHVVLHGLQFVNTVLDLYHGLLLDDPPQPGSAIFLGTFRTDANGDAVFDAETQVDACVDLTFIGLTFHGEPWSGPDGAVAMTGPLANRSCFVCSS
jgi:hypothetical protein